MSFGENSENEVAEVSDAKRVFWVGFTARLFLLGIGATGTRPRRGADL